MTLFNRFLIKDAEKILNIVKSNFCEFITFAQFITKLSR